jgi:flagellar motor switch protein FliN/FliY
MSGSSRRVSSLEGLHVDLTIVLGRTRMPVHMLLRMGRGAVIELESSDSDMVEILANDHPIARGQVIVTGTRIQVEITEIIPKPESVDEPGVSIGDALSVSDALEAGAELAAAQAGGEPAEKAGRGGRPAPLMERGRGCKESGSARTGSAGRERATTPVLVLHAPHPPPLSTRERGVRSRPSSSAEFFEPASETPLVPPDSIC